MNTAAYYAIFTDQSGIDGIPGSLQIRMFENEIQGDAFSRENTVQYEWMKAGFNDYQLKSELSLYSKHEYLDFDYYRYANNFLVSEDFLNAIAQYNIDYEKSAVRVFSAVGNLELKFRKKYYFVKFRYAEDVVNFELSTFEDALSDKGEPIIHNGVRYVKNYENIVLHEDRIPAEIFLIKDAKLGYNLLCTESVRLSPAVDGLKGLLFVPLEDFMDFKNNNGSLGGDAYQRIKSREVQRERPPAVNAEDTSGQNKDKYDIQYRALTAEELAEVERLAGVGISRLTAAGHESDLLIDQMKDYVDTLKSNQTNSEYLAYELGSVFGQLIISQYGWRWMYITVDGEGSICVQSPDKRFACKVHNYLYSLLTTDRTNNLKLLFNMLTDLDKTRTQSQMIFLN